MRWGRGAAARPAHRTYKTHKTYSACWADGPRAPIVTEVNSNRCFGGGAGRLSLADEVPCGNQFGISVPVGDDGLVTEFCLAFQFAVDRELKSDGGLFHFFTHFPAISAMPRNARRHGSSPRLSFVFHGLSAESFPSAG